MVGVEDLQYIAADIVTHVGELVGGEAEQAARRIVLLAYDSLDASIVGIDFPEFLDNDIALGRVVGVEAPLGGAGMVGDPLDRDRIVAMLGEEFDGTLVDQALRRLRFLRL